MLVVAALVGMTVFVLAATFWDIYIVMCRDFPIYCNVHTTRLVVLLSTLGTRSRDGSLNIHCTIPCLFLGFRPMPYQPQNVPLPPPILGPQPSPPRITPMNQVMVEELSQSWMEPNPQITEAYAEQPLAMQEDDEYISYLSHYVVQGDQHIPVYQTAPVNTKARDMNSTTTRPPIQCYKCSGPHKANECPL